MFRSLEEHYPIAIYYADDENLFILELNEQKETITFPLNTPKGQEEFFKLTKDDFNVKNHQIRKDTKWQRVNINYLSNEDKEIIEEEIKKILDKNSEY